MLRLFIRAMHNRVGPSVDVARDLRSPTGSCSCRSCVVILALALYPQFALDALRATAVDAPAVASADARSAAVEREP